MPLNNSEFLQTLINTGPDAMSNLYQASFLFPNTTSSIASLLNNMSCRITNFTPPSLSTSTTDVPYLGTNITIEAPGVNTDKRLSLSLRIDDDYSIYKFIKKSLSVTPTGNFYPLKGNLFELTVTSYRPNFERQLEAVNTWKFYDCRFVNENPITFDYSNAGAITTTIELIFNYYEEI